MNKLISRNPIERFKQGRKIVKAQNSWGKDFGTKYIPPKNNTKVPQDWYYIIDRGSANTLYMDDDIIKHDFRPYKPDQDLNYHHSGFVADAYNDLYDTQQRALQIATHNIKKAKSFNKRSYDNSVIDPEHSYAAENKRHIVNIEQPKKKTPVNNIWLKGYKHDEVKDVKAMQNELIKLGLLKDKFGADGKWGDNTEKAYQTYLSLKNIPVYEKPETPSVAAMAGIYSEENKPLYQRIRFKQGGQLPSRNIVKRFKLKIKK